MSQENVEIARRATALWNEVYDNGEVTDDLLALIAPDCQIDASHRVFNAATYDGHAGLRRVISEISDAWEDFRAEDDRLIDLGDKVLALQTISGRGRASGAEVRAPGAIIWTLRDEQVVHIEVYTDQTEALKAVGLADPGD